jgi:hypothetical protein
VVTSSVRFHKLTQQAKWTRPFGLLKGRPVNGLPTLGRSSKTSSLARNLIKVSPLEFCRPMRHSGYQGTDVSYDNLAPVPAAVVTRPMTSARRLTIYGTW